MCCVALPTAALCGRDDALRRLPRHLQLQVVPEGGVWLGGVGVGGWAGYGVQLQGVPEGGVSLGGVRGAAARRA